MTISSKSSPTGKNAEVWVLRFLGPDFASIVKHGSAFQVDVTDFHRCDGVVARARQDDEGDQRSIALFQLGLGGQPLAVLPV